MMVSHRAPCQVLASCFKFNLSTYELACLYLCPAIVLRAHISLRLSFLELTSLCPQSHPFTQFDYLVLFVNTYSIDVNSPHVFLLLQTK